MVHERAFWPFVALRPVQLARPGEWIRSVEQLTDAEYQPYFDTFQPAADCAREWARAARMAGAQYVVFTTKHHDGFCLFDSRLTEFKSTNTPARRDLVREYVDAVRAEGLRVGLYYSLMDWHHPDYPACGDRQHPLRHHPDARARDAHCVWERYLEYLHGQVHELCSKYGVMDVLVFDFSYWDFHGERWGASELMRMIRALQPDVVVNDRLGCESIKAPVPPAYAGDYYQAETDVPREPVCDRAGRPIPWESWCTLNNQWAHNPDDHDYKSTTAVIHALVNCVSKGGNLLLNVAPDPHGHLNTHTLATLEDIGTWLARNGESIYGCGPAALPKPEWGRWTQRGNTLYAHILEPVIGHISLQGLRGLVNHPHVLATNQPALLCDLESGHSDL